MAGSSDNVFTALAFAAFLTLLAAVIFVFLQGMELTGDGAMWWMNGL